MAQSIECASLPNIEICEINAGDGDGADIVFNYGKHKISVSVSHSATTEGTQGSTEERLIDLFDRAATVDEEYEEIVDEILDLILGAGRDASDNITGEARSVANAVESLHAALYPHFFAYSLKSVSDKISVVPIDPGEAYTTIEDGGFDIDASLPLYSSDQIIIAESLVHGGGSAVASVVLDGKPLLCKAHGRGLRDPRLARELAAHHKMHAASEDPSRRMRVPRLPGYVTHARKGSIVGLLREWIPAQLLRHIDVAAVPAATKGKWASQIRETVEKLHGIGAVWGDGKAGNVVIDEEQNAWLIEFGGGWTEGWVDEELADSVAGDGEALMRISAFLGV